MNSNPLLNESSDPLIRQTKVSGHTFTVDARYDFCNARIIGRGSFGVVNRAFDTLRGVDIAIKRVRPYADDIWDAVHLLREIKIIKRLSYHPNVMCFLSFFLWYANINTNNDIVLHFQIDYLLI